MEKELFNKKINIPNYFYNGNKDALKGKTIENIAYLNPPHAPEGAIVIKYTDGTYSILTSWYCPEEGEALLENNYLPSTCNGEEFRIDSEGKVSYTIYGQMLHDFGLYDVDVEEAKEFMNKKKEKEDEQEYKRYLELKKKFEQNGTL